MTNNGLKQVCVITTIEVSVSIDNSWCCTRHNYIVARNVLAIAETGTQIIEWSLCNFLAAGLERSMLVFAPDLVATNYSGIKLSELFSPS